MKLVGDGAASATTLAAVIRTNPTVEREKKDVAQSRIDASRFAARTKTEKIIGNLVIRFGRKIFILFSAYLIFRLHLAGYIYTLMTAGASSSHAPNKLW